MEKEQLLDRIRKGPVAVIECYEEIPCDPCRTSCPKKAITLMTQSIRSHALIWKDAQGADCVWQYAPVRPFSW